MSGPASRHGNVWACQWAQQHTGQCLGLPIGTATYRAMSGPASGHSNIYSKVGSHGTIVMGGKETTLLTTADQTTQVRGLCGRPSILSPPALFTFSSDSMALEYRRPAATNHSPYTCHLVIYHATSHHTKLHDLFVVSSEIYTFY
jgi:hypothetical protein